MNKIWSFFKLVRWPNLLITAVTMCLVYHSVMRMQGNLAFVLLVIAMALIQAGGYVINDIFDKEIDAINKPDKLIVGKIFTEKQCEFFYIVLIFIGLGCALASSIIATGRHFLTIFACFMLLVCLLFSYSKRYKKKLIVGNVIVSLSVAFAVFAPWLFEMLHISDDAFLLVNNNMQTSLRIVLIYTAFAFFMNLIREIVKDMEDVKGDERSCCRTIPIVWGITAAQIIVILLCFVTGAIIWNAAGYLSTLGFKITYYMLYASGFLVLSTVALGNVLLLADKSLRTEKQFRLHSMVLKISMLIGVLSMFFIKIC